PVVTLAIPTTCPTWIISIFIRGLLFVFFFQAEDGIRDFHVTGVQTCALPIFIERLIDDAAGRLENSPRASRELAEAIMTTDTYPKEVAVEFELKNGKKARIGAVAKGSGMIAPNMATMLAFITTDVDATPSALKKAL